MKQNRNKVLLLVVIYGNMILLGFINNLRGITFPLIKNSFQASYNDQGLLVAMVSFISVLACIAAGVFMGHFGLKKTFLSGFLFFMLGMGALFFSSGFWMAACLYLLLQTGCEVFEIAINGAGVRIFTARSALMLNLLHFFYGVGAIAGPCFAGFIVNMKNSSWQHVYPAGLIPVFVMLVITICTIFPGNSAGSQDQKNDQKDEKRRHVSFWSALKKPEVWLFGCILGLSGALDSGTVNWAGLFLQDVYGLDPSTTGALFFSLFFIPYTLSRLLSGFVIEKIGYSRSLLYSGCIIAALYIIGFGLGRHGIWVLPATGIFIAIIWPTTLAVSVGFFKQDAQAMSSPIITISFMVNGLIQYSLGLINRFAGPAWGYRSCTLYTAVIIVLFIQLRRMLHRAEAVQR
jgi:fucose permease